MMMPHQRRSPAALQGVMEAFVTRVGTDDGTQDVSLATTVGQVRHQLGAGTAVLVSDADTERCTMPPPNALPDHG
jgi:uncharacterized protein